MFDRKKGKANEGGRPPASIEEALGKSYQPDKNDYVLARHAMVGYKVHEGFKVVGEVKDATSNQDGTLVILERAK